MVVVMTGGWAEVKRWWVLVVWGLGVWERKENGEDEGESCTAQSESEGEKRRK
jgi:hypothetical protein